MASYQGGEEDKGERRNGEGEVEDNTMINEQ